jgi:hypothetical protein
MAVEKMTKKDKFMVAIEMAKANGNEMLVEFFTHEIELLDKKKSNGNAKANEKMEKSVELVYNALVGAGKAVTVSELIAETDLSALANESGVVSTAKVTAYLQKLLAVGKVVNYKDKKKSYYKVAETDTE